MALKQSGPWTVGALANHIWSVTGNSEYGDVSATFLQPFVSYTTPKATSFTLNTESTYDWEDERVVGADQRGRRAGGEDRQAARAVRSRRRATGPSSPEEGPDGWGGRFAVTLVFPKKR